MGKKRRKNRRIKKTKYLSLRLQFSSENQAHISNDQMPTPSDHPQQLDLLNNDSHDDSMEYLLSASDGGATTLTGLLDSAGAVDGADELSASASASASVTYASEAMKLVRTALRSRERESSSEERYVRYSEVVDEQRRDHEEVSSRVGVGTGDWYYSNNNNNNNDDDNEKMTMVRRLSLKLDYQEILKAWSDKGDLYIHSDFPQTVPDIDINHLFSSHPIPVSSGGGLWSVPEKNGGAMSKFKIEEEEEVIGIPFMKVGTGVGVRDDEDHRPPEEWKCQREASVLRYKEKRRNRLFSKTIRYQVRKENAQKRPRVKGRFVKRS